jgi:hypothetical protein
MNKLKLLKFPKKRPLFFAISFTSFKTGLADYLVQTYVEKEEQFDWKRNLGFWVFGAWFLGAAQYGLYVKVFDRIFPRAEKFTKKTLKNKIKDFQGQRDVLKQVSIDMLLWEPFVYFPCFYQTKIQIQGGSAEDAFNAYKRNFTNDITTFWKVGVPTYLINFTFIPYHYRVPFVGAYSLIWTGYISKQRGKEM